MKEQIEEMAEILTSANPYVICKGQLCSTCELKDISEKCYCGKALYNAGYRKQSEVEREIFEEIIKAVCSNFPLRATMTISGRQIGDPVEYGKEMAFREIIARIAEIKNKHDVNYINVGDKTEAQE